jgi:hypothetical protein
MYVNVFGRNDIRMEITLYSIKHLYAPSVASANCCTTLWKGSPAMTNDLISPVLFPAAVVRAVCVLANTLVSTKLAVLNHHSNDGLTQRVTWGSCALPWNC